MAINKKDFMKAKKLEGEISQTKETLSVFERIKKDGYKWYRLKAQRPRYFLHKSINYEIIIDLDDIDYLIRKYLQRLTSLEKELAEIVTK